MAILIPGKRDRYGRLQGGGRSAVAVLQLTAMVDLFTVLAVFLLQNYSTTGQVLSMVPEIQLPSASSIKKLRPSPVILVSHKKVALNKKVILDTPSVQKQKDWIIDDLDQALKEQIKKEQEKYRRAKRNLISLIRQEKAKNEKKTQDESLHRVTIQADKNIDFLTIKKVIFTALESGIHEVNFAVLQKEKESKTFLQ